MLAAFVLVGLVAVPAVAVLFADAGGTQVRVDLRSETTAQTTNSVAFVDLPGANATVVVPANSSRLVEAAFSGESRCAGPGGGGWCSTRVIATNTVTGASVELRPQAGIDYAFDTDMTGATDDLYEGHAMDRVMRLPGGANGATYRIRVQWVVTNNTIQFRLDDWLLTVRTDV